MAKTVIVTDVDGRMFAEDALQHAVWATGSWSGDTSELSFECKISPKLISCSSVFVMHAPHITDEAYWEHLAEFIVDETTGTITVVRFFLEKVTA